MSNEVMCTACSGSGLGESGDSYSTCTICNGGGGVSLRNEKGQFASYSPEVQTNEIIKKEDK